MPTRTNRCTTRIIGTKFFFLSRPLPPITPSLEFLARQDNFRDQSLGESPMEMTITQRAPPCRDWRVHGRAGVSGALGLVQQIMGCPFYPNCKKVLLSKCLRGGIDDRMIHATVLGLTRRSAQRRMYCNALLGGLGSWISPRAGADLISSILFHFISLCLT